MNKTVPLNKIKLNPNNPRTIRDDKFKKLVESLKSFPEMMKLRPIVVNKNMIILGGNMRYEAAKAAGWKEIDIIIADKLTKRQEEEFIIKDNMPYGEWDFDILANEFETEDLVNWGFEGYELGLGIDKINEKEEWDNNEMPEFNHNKEIMLVVYFKSTKQRESYCKKKEIVPTTMREGQWTLRMWRLKYNEDIDLCLQILHNKLCTIQLCAYLAIKVSTTAKLSGGNQDELYKGNDPNKKLLKAKSIETIWPQYVKTVIRFGRPHHQISWKKHFKHPLRKAYESAS